MMPEGLDTTELRVQRELQQIEFERLQLENQLLRN